MLEITFAEYDPKENEVRIKVRIFDRDRISRGQDLATLDYNPCSVEEAIQDISAEIREGDLNYTEEKMEVRDELHGYMSCCRDCDGYPTSQITTDLDITIYRPSKKDLKRLEEAYQIDLIEESDGERGSDEEPAEDEVIKRDDVDHLRGDDTRNLTGNPLRKSMKSLSLSNRIDIDHTKLLASRERGGYLKVELQRITKQLGLKETGTKSELVDRILTAY